jgi:hypothetical protein
MSLTLPYPTLTTSPATKAEVDSNFTTISSKFGAITNADIASSAAISVDKLSAQYEYTFIQLKDTATTATAAIKDFVPIYNDGKGAWTVAGASYIMKDAGSTSPTFTIIFGYPTDASTTFNTTTTVVAATTPTASAGNYRHANLTLNATTITPTSNNESLALNVTGAGTASGALFISVLLKRKIAT